MQITENTIIGQLVADDYRMAAVFEKNEIDFCCQGNRSIAEATQALNLDTKEVLEQLENIKQQNTKTTTEEDFKNWPLDLLADYIEKKHHRYTEAKISELKPLLAKLVEVHGEENPELLEIQKTFDISAGEMASHMKKEELILFPFIRKIIHTKKSNSKMIVPHFGTVENPVNMMMHEHDEQGRLLQKMAKLSNNYTPPENACNTYRVTYGIMKEFETDMHKHIHLENNILFPKAVALEKTLEKE